MNIPNPFVVGWKIVKGVLRVAAPLIFAVARTLFVTAFVTLLGFVTGYVVDIFHLAPISFKAVGAVVAFVSHVWGASHK